MGHKVNPKVFRLKTLNTWNSKWFSNLDYADRLAEDIKMRKFLETKLKDAYLDRVEIDRTTDTIEIIVHSARPGVIIGKGGSAVDELKKHITQKILKNNKTKVNINIKEVSKPNLSSRIIAQGVAGDLERRIPYRRVVKKHIEQVMKAGAKGIKITCAGRLGGVDIARTESLSEGKIPLHTIRADIDYSRLVANTTYGVIGVKVWIYKGDVFNKKEESSEKELKSK